MGEPDWAPLRLISKSTVRPAVAGFMRLARVGIVTPLRDGMNLVAKEFVAAQNPADPGVLVLSHFAGAAHQLHDAILVNPHDADAMADALYAALRMGLAERQARWRSLWSAIQNRTPVAWGRNFVAALLRATAAAAQIRHPMPGFAPAEQLVAHALPGQRITLEHAEFEPAVDPRHLN